MPLLMELSKILRTVRQALDATLCGGGIEEWQVTQFSRAYVTCNLPSYSIDHIPLDTEPAAATARVPDPYSDPEKVKKVRSIALQAVRSSIINNTQLYYFSKVVVMFVFDENERY